MSNLAAAFAGLKDEAREHPSTQVPKPSGAQAPKSVSAQAPRRARTQALSLPLQGTAKSKHPDFAAVKVFLRKDTHRRAKRKYEDEAGVDFSDLVETLLLQYLRT